MSEMGHSRRSDELRGMSVTPSIADIRVGLVDKDFGNSGESLSSGNAELWLESEALRIVIERMQCTAPLAKVRIERWRRDLDGDAAATVAAISAADRTNLVGSRFHNLIVDTIRVLMRGPQLPCRRDRSGSNEDVARLVLLNFERTSVSTI
jgi:hypothetical protein